MFGHKTFLRIGQLTDGSLQGLYRESYELESCEYSFSQGYDHKGQPQSDTLGGAIHITYPGLPPQEILEWALNHRKYHDGVIVICDQNEQPLEKIGFEKAALVKLKIDYSQKGKGLFSTKIVLQAFSLQVGVHFLTNKWTGF
ncbi:MAG: type VI secretion system needle protein Hcp [Tannerella sp.]|jgi:hypothetical protein|nr:type VI secretion system needle protein Hcp [Tannerella sp.]